MLAIHEIVLVIELKHTSDTARENSRQQQNKPGIVTLLHLLVHLQSNITERGAIPYVLETGFIYCFNPRID